MTDPYQVQWWVTPEEPRPSPAPVPVMGAPSLGPMSAEWLIEATAEPEIEPSDCRCDAAVFRYMSREKRVRCVEPADGADGLCSRCRLECVEKRES